MRSLLVLPVALAGLALVPVGAGAQLPCVPPLCTPSGGGSPSGGGGPSGGATPNGTTATPAATFAAVSKPEVGIEDEGHIFTSQAPSLAATWRSMGVDYVRIQAFWNALSPGTNSPTRPANFNPANPNDPQYRWAPLDSAIAAVRNNGMRVMLTLNQSNPRWASTQPSVAKASWRPNPKIYAQFVTAVGKRYGRQVDRYLLLSEPNQLPFLAPQFTCKRRKCTPVAPHLARDLSNAAYTAIKRADPRAQTIIGELAPIGSPPSRTGGVTPLLFLQQFGCVNAKFRPIHSGACRKFKAPRGDGFGYHPYTNTKTSPFRPTRNKSLAKIGDLSRLLSWVDKLSTRRRMRHNGGGRFPIYLTEYGYITNPPNRKYGVSWSRQSLFNSESAYVVWTKRSRFKLLTQYEYFDDPNFPTGLLTSGGRAKPSLTSFPTPFYVDTRRGRRRARFWGQVRPDFTGRVSLQIKRGAGFATIATAATRSGGYWSLVRAAKRRATYRFQYSTSSGTKTSQTFRT